MGGRIDKTQDTVSKQPNWSNTHAHTRTYTVHTHTCIAHTDTHTDRESTHRGSQCVSTSHQQQAPGCSYTSAMLLLLFESTRKQLTQAAATQAKWLPPFPILCSPFPFSLSLSTTADTPHCSPSLLSLKDTRQGQLGTNLRLLIKAKQCRTQCEHLLLLLLLLLLGAGAKRLPPGW